MEQTITCISCPVGCRLRVTLQDGEVTSVSGQGCNRGVTYAKQECTAPARMVTAVVPVPCRQTPLSVKTERPIPKHLIFQCMEEIRRVKLQCPIAIGQVILEDVCGTGIKVVATKGIE